MTRILVVEDSATQAQRLSSILEREGFEVVVANDGLTGFESCTETSFDAVLSDVVMPGIDGYELCRRIKRDPRTASVPVILLTTLNEPMDIIRALECGADNFITKPYEPEYLAERLRRSLELAELRKKRKIDSGVELLIKGNRLTITSEKAQIVDLLNSTLEEMLRTRKHEYEAKVRVEALRESQMLLQSAIDALTASIAIVDARGRIAAVNRAWRKLAEARKWPWPSAGVGMEYLEIFRTAFGCSAEVSQEIRRGVQSVIADATGCFVSEYATPEGGGRWFALSAAAFAGRGPKLVAIEHQDITARKTSEERLRSSEARFRTLANTASDAIVLTDEDERIVFFSEAATRIFGYSGDEVQGQPLSLLIVEGADEPTRKLLDHLDPDTQNGRVVELEGRRKGGDTFPAEVWIGSWTLNGKAHLTCILRDVTQRQQLEMQLRHAQKMEGIGQLAGGVAHDFNNVLAVIRSCAELMLAELPEGEARHDELSEILQAAERGTALTRQLLAFSRKQVLHPMTCDLNRIVRDFEKMVRRVIGRDVELVAELAPDLGHVKVDPGQIEQVLMNLVVNGRDAMPDGGKLTISTQNSALDDALVEMRSATSVGTCVVLSVSDTGTGMDRATQARIFEPFFTTKEGGKGTGLGLCTVYGIVRQSGGQILLNSELGKGTTFKIFLPRSDEPLQGPALPEVHLHQSEASQKLVLLVEDDPALRRIASRILRRSGCRLLVAADPREALEHASLQSSKIDLLITDVVMPEMSGTELANRLRLEHPDMKVLLMSGYSGNAMLRHGALPVGLHFLEKPFGPESLAQKVQAVLSENAEIGEADYQSGARFLIHKSRTV